MNKRVSEQALDAAPPVKRFEPEPDSGARDSAVAAVPMADDDTPPALPEPQPVLKNSRPLVMWTIKKEGKTMLSPHQREALLALDGHDWKKNDPQLIALPTGSGEAGVVVCAPWAMKSSKVLVITPSPTISRQLGREFEGVQNIQNIKGKTELGKSPCFALRTRVVEPGNWKACCPLVKVAGKGEYLPQNFAEAEVIIANYYKFTSKAALKLDDVAPDLFDTIIVAEAHHFPSATWDNIVKRFGPHCHILFVASAPRQGCVYNILYQLTRQQAVASGTIRGIEHIQV